MQCKMMNQTRKKRNIVLLGNDYSFSDVFSFFCKHIWIQKIQRQMWQACLGIQRNKIDVTNQSSICTTDKLDPMVLVVLKSLRHFLKVQTFLKTSILSSFKNLPKDFENSELSIYISRIIPIYKQTINIPISQQPTYNFKRKKKKKKERKTQIQLLLIITNSVGLKLT